jgi:heptosyltransferase-3
MNWRRPLLAIAGQLVRRRKKRASTGQVVPTRILVIRRNRLGDMICTLPLLHALRRHAPAAHLAVACDAVGAPIAAASGIVDEVIVLRAGGGRGAALLRNARRLQNFDCVLAAKGGFDRRLATLTRLTNAPRRLGFESRREPPSLYFTDQVPLPDTSGEHQVDTLLRLLRPLGIAASLAPASPPLLVLPPAADRFADALFAAPPLDRFSRLFLVNISSTARLKFSDADFIALAEQVIASDHEAAVLFVAAPGDQSRARALAARCQSARVIALTTPGPLELAAVMKRAHVLVTPEGGAAHLAAAVELPALVLWSEGPFEKWRSRGKNHTFLLAAPGEKTIPRDRVWSALETLLGADRPS